MTNNTSIIDEDVGRERYSGYSSQTSYQKDLQQYFDGKICGALNNQKKFCNNDPMENGRCRHHGGKSPKGLDHPRTVHGGYSRYLPERLIDKYHDAESNEDLANLKSEMALITTRLYELSEKVQDTAGKIQYANLYNTYERYKSAKRADQESAHYILLEFESMLVSVKEDLKVWDEIASLIDTKRKLVDSEFKKMKTMNQFVEVEKVMLLMGGLMDIVVREIEDLEGVLVDETIIEKTTTSIARKFKNITNKKSSNYKRNGSS